MSSSSSHVDICMRCTSAVPSCRLTDCRLKSSWKDMTAVFIAKLLGSERRHVEDP